MNCRVKFIYYTYDFDAYAFGCEIFAYFIIFVICISEFWFAEFFKERLYNNFINILAWKYKL